MVCGKTEDCRLPFYRKLSQPLPTPCGKSEEYGISQGSLCCYFIKVLFYSKVYLSGNEYVLCTLFILYMLLQELWEMKRFFLYLKTCIFSSEVEIQPPFCFDIQRIYLHHQVLISFVRQAVCCGLNRLTLPMLRLLSSKG